VAGPGIAALCQAAATVTERCPWRGLVVARRMILLNESDEVMLTEVEARNEEQLQQRLKNSPDLLPVDGFGLSDHRPRHE